MTTTVSHQTFSAEFDSVISSTTGVRHALRDTFTTDMKVSGSYVFNRVFSLQDYTLTTGAGNLDLDLYDLGTFDGFGTGAGEDNLGLSHANSKIYGMGVRNQGTGTLRIDNNGATNPWVGIFPATGIHNMASGAFFQHFFGTDGVDVTDASDHIMRLSAQTADCVIDVFFYSTT